MSERCTRMTALVLLAIGVALTELPVAALAQQPESASPEAATASEPPTKPPAEDFSQPMGPPDPLQSGDAPGIDVRIPLRGAGA